MAPSDYIQSQKLATPNNFFTTLVDGRPYLPNLTVDASNTASICNAAMTSMILSLYIAATKDASDVDKGGSLAAKDAELKIMTVSFEWESLLEESLASLTCTKVTGGITNALFRVSGFESLMPTIAAVVATLLNKDSSINSYIHLIDFNSVLVRIFGAEGMINRDIETSTYAALCIADIAYRYLGRFNNGRVEGWLDGYLPLECTDLTHDKTSLEIAKEMARLHCVFEVPEGELRDHHFGKEGDVITVGLWEQLSSWMEKAKAYSEFKTAYDTERVEKLSLSAIEREVQNFISSFATASAAPSDNGDSTASICGSAKGKKSGIVFCHNDLLAGNIMRHPETNKIQLIDFEYGGTNYAAFDIANHFNEHAGGTSVEENGQTDYSRFPNPERQKRFCVEYVMTIKRLESVKKSGLVESEADENDDVHAEATDLLNNVQKFILINHLYWGLWAINQAAEEGCDEFDYINYASNRFKEFHAKKAELEEV